MKLVGFLEVPMVQYSLKRGGTSSLFAGQRRILIAGYFSNIFDSQVLMSLVFMGDYGTADYVEV